MPSIMWRNENDSICNCANNIWLPPNKTSNIFTSSSPLQSISCNPRHVPQSLPKSSMFMLLCKLYIRYWFRLHKLIAIVTVNIIGPGGIDDENNNESSVKSDDPNRKGIQDESGFYDDDDRILNDNHKLINSMKFDDIKLETYDRVFNRSFTNPIGYKFNGKSLAHKS